MYNVNKNMPISIRLKKEGIEWALRNNIKYDDNNCIKISISQLFLIISEKNLIESDIFVSDDDFGQFCDHTTKDIHDLEVMLKDCMNNDDLLKMSQEYIINMRMELIKNEIEAKMVEIAKLEEMKANFYSKNDDKGKIK